MAAIFFWENIEHSLTQITPALQAIFSLNYFWLVRRMRDCLYSENDEDTGLEPELRNWRNDVK